MRQLLAAILLSACNHAAGTTGEHRVGAAGQTADDVTGAPVAVDVGTSGVVEEGHEVACNGWRDSLESSERIRLALSAPLGVDWTDPSDDRVLVGFFATATVESIKPFLRSDQLLQHAARYATDPDIIGFLIDSGFDPNEAFGLGYPPYPHEEVSLSREGPLHYAAKFNPDPRIIAALIEGGADVHATAGMRFGTPLHYAAQQNNSAVVSALIGNGARVEMVNGRISPSFVQGANINGNTALHWGMSNEDVRVIDALVDAGADVDRRNSSGFTPLHHAAWAGRAESFSALVRRGANPNTLVTLVEDEVQIHDCTGCNSIHLLVDSLWRAEEFDAGNFENLLKTLVGAGTDIDARIERPGLYEGYSALRLAVESELAPDVVELLIEYGAEVGPDAVHAVFSEVFKYSGRSAGAFVTRSVGSDENLKVLDLLLESDVDVNSKDSCGRTVLHKAVSFAHKRSGGISSGGISSGGISSGGIKSGGIKRAVEMLIEAGVDVNAQTDAVDAPEHCGGWGFPPLHEAVTSPPMTSR